MRAAPAPSQLDQVLPRCGVQEAGPYHPTGRIRTGPFGKREHGFSGSRGIEHDIYREDALLDYPQSGERIKGRHNIRLSRTAQPNSKRFTVHRILGRGDLWVTEFI